MIECAIPQDILKYKTKFIGNFSVRETVCIGLGGMAALASYFTLLSGLGTQPRMYISAFIAVPFFLFGFFKPLGQPLEKILIQIVYDNFICPPIRKYEIRRPEYENYLKDKPALGIVDSEELDGKSKKKKKKNSQEIKIAKSKEYKSIR